MPKGIERSFWKGGEDAQDHHAALLNKIRLIAPALLICLELTAGEPTKNSDNHGHRRTRINSRLGYRMQRKHNVFSQHGMQVVAWYFMQSRRTTQEVLLQR